MFNLYSYFKKHRPENYSYMDFLGEILYYESEGNHDFLLGIEQATARQLRDARYTKYCNNSIDPCQSSVLIFLDLYVASAMIRRDNLSRTGEVIEADNMVDATAAAHGIGNEIMTNTEWKSGPCPDCLTDWGDDPGDPSIKDWAYKLRDPFYAGTLTIGADGQIGFIRIDGITISIVYSKNQSDYWRSQK